MNNETSKKQFDILLITPLNLPWAETLTWQEKDSNSIDKQYIKRKLDPKYPVGNLCIAAYVKQNSENINVDILDYNTVAMRYINSISDKNLTHFYQNGLDLIKERHGENYSPKIIGISTLFSSNYFDMGSIIQFYREKYPQSIIVAGGHLASACYSDFLKKYEGLDAVTYGEGEIPTLRLVDAAKKGTGKEYLEKDSSWITRKKLETPDFKPTNTLIENLDEVPPYELEMCLHYEDYFETNKDVWSLGSELVKEGERDIAMFMTRGCPYRCIFCASQFVHGHRVRRYSLDRIKKDILLYNKKYGITSFPFLDDHFLHYKKEAIEILDFIHDNGFVARIFNLAYIHVDRDIVKALKKTGSDRALITIDGLNEDFLRKVVRKPAYFKKAKEVIQMFRDENMIILNNNLIGFPGETPEDIERGVNTMLDMGANWYQILTAIPLHGSELYDICQKGGYMPKDSDEFEIDFNHSIIETPDFTAEWIHKKAYEINLKLNFVQNYDIRHGEYRIPLKLYERIIEKVLSTHAFAYYFAAICAKNLGLTEKYENYKEKYNELKKDDFWKEWIDFFKLEDLI